MLINSKKQQNILEEALNWASGDQKAGKLH